VKNLLLGVVGVVAVVVLGTLGYASTQPDSYRVERSASYAASPADVFPYINDYTKWVTWNPWQNIDPDATFGMSENPVGVGAWNTWKGNAEVGEGKMTIKESVENEKVVHELHFMAPMEDTGIATHTLSADGEQTKLTWVMTGQMNLLAKVACLFMGPMDTMLGDQFEKGLATLKPKVEADAKARIAAEEAAAAAAAAVPVDGAAPVAGAAPADAAAPAAGTAAPM
jgi:hypothetical protein